QANYSMQYDSGLPKGAAAERMKELARLSEVVEQQLSTENQLASSAVKSDVLAGGIAQRVNEVYEEVEKLVRDSFPQGEMENDELAQRYLQAHKAALDMIRKNIEEGKIDPLAAMNLRKNIPDRLAQYTHPVDRELRVMYLPGNANPVVIGHPNVLMLGVAVLGADFGIHRPAGMYEVLKKLPNNPESHVSAYDRFTLADAQMQAYWPFIRMTDHMDNVEGFEQMFTFLRQNAGREIDIMYMLSTENFDRISKYIKLHYLKLGKAIAEGQLLPEHRFSMAWIRRDDGTGFGKGWDKEEYEQVIHEEHERIRTQMQDDLSDRLSRGDDVLRQDANRLREQASAKNQEAKERRRSAQALRSKGAVASAKEAEKLAKQLEKEASELTDNAIYLETPTHHIQLALERNIEMHLLDHELIDLEVSSTRLRDELYTRLVSPFHARYAHTNGVWGFPKDLEKAKLFEDYRVTTQQEMQTRLQEVIEEFSLGNIPGRTDESESFSDEFARIKWQITYVRNRLLIENYEMSTHDYIAARLRLNPNAKKAVAALRDIGNTFRSPVTRRELQVDDGLKMLNMMMGKSAVDLDLAPARSRLAQLSKRYVIAGTLPKQELLDFIRFTRNLVVVEYYQSRVGFSYAERIVPEGAAAAMIRELEDMEYTLAATSASSAVKLDDALEQYRSIVKELRDIHIDEAIVNELLQILGPVQDINGLRETIGYADGRLQRESSYLEIVGNSPPKRKYPNIGLKAAGIALARLDLKDLSRSLAVVSPSASSALEKKDSTPRGGMDFAREVLETAGESAVSFDMVPLEPEAIRGLRVEVTILERAPAAGSYAQN
ncbi:MAG: hypothetical protein MJA29_02575, partial [Candidatus Omnitrophica bacterium]|nr:hypothetical protein [Candidatus Omnitrophota bacterium]